MFVLTWIKVDRVALPLTVERQNFIKISHLIVSVVTKTLRDLWEFEWKNNAILNTRGCDWSSTTRQERTTVFCCFFLKTIMPYPNSYQKKVFTHLMDRLFPPASTSGSTGYHPGWLGLLPNWAPHSSGKYMEPTGYPCICEISLEEFQAFKFLNDSITTWDASFLIKIMKSYTDERCMDAAAYPLKSPHWKPTYAPLPVKVSVPNIIPNKDVPKYTVKLNRCLDCLRLKRNEEYGHVADDEFSTLDFNEIMDEIKRALVGIYMHMSLDDASILELLQRVKHLEECNLVPSILSQFEDSLIDSKELISRLKNTERNRRFRLHQWISNERYFPGAHRYEMSKSVIQSTLESQTFHRCLVRGDNFEINKENGILLLIRNEGIELPKIPPGIRLVVGSRIKMEEMGKCSLGESSQEWYLGLDKRSLSINQLIIFEEFGSWYVQVPLESNSRFSVYCYHYQDVDRGKPLEIGSRKELDEHLILEFGSHSLVVNQIVKPYCPATICSLGTTRNTYTKYLRFNMSKPIGIGGFGVVYEGFLLETRDWSRVGSESRATFTPRVVLKVPLDLTSSKLEAIEREKSAILSLQGCPFIIKVSCFVRISGIPAIIYERANEDNLAVFIQERLNTSVGESYLISRQKFAVIISITAQLAQAMIYAMERGIFHCDIKPENILVKHRTYSPQGENKNLLQPQIALADFGGFGETRLYDPPSFISPSSKGMRDFWCFLLVFLQMLILKVDDEKSSLLECTIVPTLKKYLETNSTPGELRKWLLSNEDIQKGLISWDLSSGIAAFLGERFFVLIDKVVMEHGETDDAMWQISFLRDILGLFIPILTGWCKEGFLTIDYVQYVTQKFRSEPSSEEMFELHGLNDAETSLLVREMLEDMDNALQYRYSRALVNRLFFLSTSDRDVSSIYDGLLSRNQAFFSKSDWFRLEDNTKRSIIERITSTKNIVGFRFMVRQFGQPAIDSLKQGALNVIHRFAKENFYEAIGFLVSETGLDINVDEKNERNGRTALMYAVIHNNPECVRVLLVHHADKDITCSRDKTALNYASSLCYHDIESMLKETAANEI